MFSMLLHYTPISIYQRNNAWRFIYVSMGKDWKGFNRPISLLKNRNKLICIIQGLFSKFVVTITLRDISAEVVSYSFINNFALKYGISFYVHIDNGIQFESSYLKKNLNKIGMCKTKSSSYHPQSDGLV